VKTIVVTGASGVVGSALLPHLDGMNLICTAHRRRGEFARATWVQSDLTRPRLGLTARAFRHLARRADAIVHCAAITDFNVDERLLREMNNAGTDNVLELAAAADAPLYHVSTAFVAREHAAREDSGPARYIASKRLAEEQVRSSGVQAALIRPSVVIGDSTTGRIGRFQGLHALAGAMLRNSLPIVPLREDARIDFVPQDVVGATIARLVRDGVGGGEWWITAGEHAPSLQAVIECCQDLAYSLGLDLTRPRLMDSDVVDRLIRPVFIQTLPEQARERFDQLLHMTSLFEGSTPFPSSLAALSLAVSTAELVENFERSMRYWAACKGLDRSRLAA
jgi:nucleoside-diphosphate-sugar epimerase